MYPSDDDALATATKRAEDVFRRIPEARMYDTNVDYREFTFRRGPGSTAVLVRRGRVGYSDRENFPSWDAGR